MNNHCVLKIYRVVRFIATPFLMFFLCEYCFNNSITSMRINAVFCDIVICFLIELCFVGAGVVEDIIYSLLYVLSTVVGMANYYSYLFRGSPIMINDIYSISTAQSVIGNYDFSITKQIQTCIVITGILVVLNLLILVGKVITKRKSYINNTGIKYRLIISAVSIFVLFIWIRESSFDIFTGQLSLWNPWMTYQESGFASSAIAFWQTTFIDTPDHYRQGISLELENDDAEENGNSYDAPIVIAIMNEAFADLSVLGQLEIEDDPFAFYHSLVDNKGTLLYGYHYASTHGGGTAKTEFEYLTGFSHAFIPGVIAYTQLNMKNVPSLVSDYKRQGYYAVAMHPYYGYNYKRSDVYNDLGFDEFITIEGYYGYNSEIIGNYTSDVDDYRMLLDYIDKHSNMNLFIFNVTIQNHSPYYMDMIQNVDQIKIPLKYEQFEDFVVYQNLMKESDAALEYLIRNLENIDRTVILCFFGDHLPAINQDFCDNLCGGKFDSLSFDQYENYYKVPYFIWTNSSDPYVNDPLKINSSLTSTNYLGVFTEYFSGIRLSHFNHFLLELQKNIIAMNEMGYLDSDYKWHNYSDEDSYSRLMLQRYEVLQYNGLIDHNKRLDLFYAKDDGE